MNSVSTVQNSVLQGHIHGLAKVSLTGISNKDGVHEHDDTLVGENAGPALWQCGPREVVPPPFTNKRPPNSDGSVPTESTTIILRPTSPACANGFASWLGPPLSLCEQCSYSAKSSFASPFTRLY